MILPLETLEDMGQRGHCNVNCYPLKHHLLSGKVVKKKKSKTQNKTNHPPPSNFSRSTYSKAKKTKQ